jgi:uncharacterized protein
MSESLVIFAKMPHPGGVKTRLAPPLSLAQAAAVHQACVLDVVALATAAVVDVRIFHDDRPGADAYFARAFPGIGLSAQCPGDLGDRLSDAFSRMFAEGVERVVIIGADSPTLPPDRLSEGLAALHRHEIALGPATDGGYYLVAIRRGAWPQARAVFEDIPWSREQVLEMTLARAEAVGFRPHLLEPWYDIDRIGDLERARRDTRAHSHLRKLLSQGAFRFDGRERIVPPGE